MADQSIPALGVARTAYTVAILALAGIIFVLDAITPVEVSVAVLYVLVILLASRVYGVNGLLLVGLACAALTLAVHFVSPGDPWAPGALLDRALGLFGVLAATLLVVKIRSSENTLREQANLLNLTHDSIFARDAKDTVTYWNRGAEELYGWRGDDATGKVLDQITRTTFPRPLEEIMQELSTIGRWEGRLVRTRHDGKQGTVASRWSVQRDDRGRFSGVLETNNDITERQRVEDALQQTQADLARVSRVTTMGQLAASIAHEVNQPLTGVVTNGYTCLHWLKEDTLNLDKARATAERIVRDGERASGVIQRIRTLMAKSPPQSVDVDLNHLIREVIALTQTELRVRQVAVRTELAPDLPSMPGDPVQLQQVLLNLIINGIDAMAGVADRPRILVVGSRLEVDGDGLVFVRDHGTGLDQETADKIFAPFFTTKPNGTGMGLAICRSIIEAHAGRLWASPANPHGALFQFTIPSKAAELHA
jgi:two-component system, LuxR family, sensor kinase FixL